MCYRPLLVRDATFYGSVRCWYPLTCPFFARAFSPPQMEVAVPLRSKWRSTGTGDATSIYGGHETVHRSTQPRPGAPRADSGFCVSVEGASSALSTQCDASSKICPLLQFLSFELTFLTYPLVQNCGAGNLTLRFCQVTNVRRHDSDEPHEFSGVAAMIWRLVERIFGPRRGNIPPRLPSRCAIPLLESEDAEALRGAVDAWRRDEERYVSWVDAHPRPRSEWLKMADRLRRMHRG